MAYELPRIISVSGRTIKIAHLDSLSSPLTYLASDVAAAGTVLTVLDNSGFSDNNLMLIGKLGSEKTEIKDINGAVSAGTSITSNTLTFAHSTGTEIRKVLFNQYKIYGTTTSTYATTNAIATIAIAVDEPYTTYVNTGTEYEYYWATPYDSVNSVTGVNSEAIAATTGYPTNSVGHMIKSSLTTTKKKKGGIITDEWFFDEINDCAEYIASKLKRWSFLQSFEYVLGQSIQGSNAWALPSDIQDPNSLKSILAVRVGSNSNLLYRDKKEWNDLLLGVVHTQVRTEASAADTELDIDNSYSLADEGSVEVFVSGTGYTTTYESMTRSATAGELKEIPASGTGAISVTLPVDSEVWQGHSESQPLYFTVYDSYLYVWPLPNADYDNLNVLLDYNTTRTRVNSASDQVEPTRYLLFVHWLRWKLRSLDNASGALDPQDTDFIMFNSMLGDMAKTEVSGQKHKMKPKVNRIKY